MSSHTSQPIEVTSTAIRGPDFSLALGAVSAVWVSRRSALRPLKWLGLLALLGATTMGSCGGVLLGAVQQDMTFDDWLTFAALLGVVGIALLVAARISPPFVYGVALGLDGQEVLLWETPDPKAAEVLRTAIARARGL